MSDEFDREAEREKLREKYERDQEKREASERMSELLLQGATMTNRHCPECQSPVFTYEGTAFCPTCQREVTDEGELAGEGERREASEQASGMSERSERRHTSGEADRSEPSDTASGGREAERSETGADTSGVRREPRTGEADAEPGAARSGGGAEADGDGETGHAGTDGRTATGSPDAGGEAERSPGEPPAGDDREAAPRQSREETRPATTPERRPARVDPPARRADAGGDRREERRDLEDAEAALVREITNLTRRAEETRDVGRKRDFFAAAREAAETLETIRRV
ncbi:hypothetical protein BRC85_08835 [Halobacteriales archaeon QS_1_69_70]|nr:MAG: hypothetical protein BRC85_08835 [Halobacteriales archaeon QS_1_69_70]